jgi:hypothetical protein
MSEVLSGCAVRAAIQQMEPNLKVSDDGRTVKIFGIRYDIELFRHLGIAPIGSRIEIIERPGDGTVTLQRLPDESEDARDAARYRFLRGKAMDRRLEAFVALGQADFMPDEARFDAWVDEERSNG